MQTFLILIVVGTTPVTMTPFFYKESNTVVVYQGSNAFKSCDRAAGQLRLAYSARKTKAKVNCVNVESLMTFDLPEFD